MTLRRRLYSIFIIVVVACSAASFLLVWLATGTIFRSFVYSGDAAKAEWYAAALKDYHSGGGTWEQVPRYLQELSRSSLYGSSMLPDTHGGSDSAYPATDRIILTDATGIVIADTSGLLLGSAHPPRHLEHGVRVAVDNSFLGTILVGSMVDSSLQGTDRRYLVMVTASLLGSTLFAASLAFALGLISARRITRPVEALETAVKRIASGDLSALVPVEGDDEIVGLSSSFNLMARELASLEAAKRRMIADAAHELRTPVTLIRGMMEGLIDGIYPLSLETLRSVHEEALRLSRLIDTLRDLELIESGRLVLDKVPVDVSHAVSKAATLFATAAKDRRIHILVDLEEPRPPALSADPFRLDQVLYNLLSNAVRHARQAGKVRASVHTDPVSVGVQITIEDDGPGIPPAERDKVFERFYRLDSSRCLDSGGRGLGLSIAREIVRTHGGSISVSESSLGGAAFVVWLPVY